MPKLCGADVELGNFLVGVRSESGTGREASRALLREIDGLPRRPGDWSAEAPYPAVPMGFPRPTWAANPQDWGRKFLASNGGCVYIDLDHLELCVPEVISAFDHVAAWHAMLRIARGALVAANARLPEGVRLEVLINNSDGLSHSYGSHLNFLITRRAWNDLFCDRPHFLAVLAAFQASSIVLTGQGKVGAENGRAPVAYQLSARADFFEQLIGLETTHDRPIVNSRDEALCGRPLGLAGGRERHMARLHCIFFDSTLCHGSSLLRVGAMQLVLAMLEAGRANPNRILDDPVAAVVAWSHDPSLRAKAAMATGDDSTAVELQLRFLEDAREFVARGGGDGIVPRAEEILALWEDTLGKLAARDFAALTPRLDWVLKLALLRRAMEERSDLIWESPEMKLLDHRYGSLDERRGLYWGCESSGAVERVVDEAHVDRLVHEPPEDTRAWTRAMLLRSARPGSVVDVDWDAVHFELQGGRHFTATQRIELADPLSFTRRQSEPIFRRARGLQEILEGLDRVAENSAGEFVDGDGRDAAKGGSDHGES